MGLASSYVVFLVALCILMAVNYPDQKLQDKLVKKHAPAALIISATLFAAGAMVGIFDGTGMLTEMANAIMSVIPSAMGKYIHVIFGLLALPLVPATFLAIGLTNTELKDHMKFSIPPYYAVSVVMLIFGIVMGIIPL